MVEKIKIGFKVFTIECVPYIGDNSIFTVDLLLYFIKLLGFETSYLTLD